MDEEQLEAYRRRMQEKYLSKQLAEAVSSPKVEEDAAFKQLQEQEFASATTSDEELARKLQFEEGEPEVRPPIDIQREERLVDPAEYDYPEEEAKPLLPIRRESCWSRSRRICRNEPGTVALAGFALVTLVGLLILLFVIYLR